MKLTQDSLITSYEIFLKNSIEETAKTKRQNQLLSFCFTLPNEFLKDNLPLLLKDCEDGFYSFANGEELLAIGNIFSLIAAGAKRWNIIEKEYTKLPEPLFNSREPQFIDAPQFITTVKFSEEKQSEEWSGFKNIEFYIPKFLVKSESGSLLFRFNEMLSPTFAAENSVSEFKTSTNNIFADLKANDDEVHFNYETDFDLSNEKETWNRKVEQSLVEIKRNALTKIVLARKISLSIKSPIPFEVLPGKLIKANPSANIFFIKKNDSVFLGASPEILIELQNDTIRTDAIAGSRKRGSTPEEDFLLENELFNSDKERNEHNSVVDFLVSHMTNLASVVQYDKTPTIKKLTSIQHLSTLVTARLKFGSSIFSLIDKIFPTPAVCGSPKEKAMKLISELEDFDRGLYAGLIGWFSPSSVKLTVAIRSALINKNAIFVYAGCGIVEGSNSESEFAETETKFKTILSAFNEKS